MVEEPKIENITLSVKKKIKEKKDILVNRENRVQIKIHQLVITNLEGIYLNWLRFPNQFAIEI